MTRTAKMSVWWNLSAILVGALLVIGCSCQSLKTGEEVNYNDNFFPDQWGHKDASLILGGIGIEATIEFEAKDKLRILHINGEKGLLEDEVYEVTTEFVGLCEKSTGEKFEPSLTLLKFPMKIGDKFSWKGDVVYFDRKIPATAEVSTGTESISIATGVKEALRVDVQLSMNDGSNPDMVRAFTIWFVSDEGPVKRRFGPEIREPRLPGEKVKLPEKSKEQDKG